MITTRIGRWYRLDVVPNRVVDGRCGMTSSPAGFDSACRALAVALGC
jgi:hypothetical protein